MKKDTLLKLIAEKGYVISYAANLNFATYVIVTGLPPSVSSSMDVTLCQICFRHGFL